MFVCLSNRAEQKSHFVGKKAALLKKRTIFIRHRSEDQLEVNMDGGGGDSFDPCECICSHEGAMRRLISLVSSDDAFVNQLITQKLLSEQNVCASRL